MVLEQMPTEWKSILPASFWGSASYHNLLKYTQTPRSKPVYPAQHNIFKALELVRPCDVRVVFLGQDPYHNPSEAHGLAFSVPHGVKTPPSLRNIFKELHEDIGCVREKTDLTDWARQGVLLLNSSLTVEENNPGSDLWAWEGFTDALLQGLSQNTDHIVFVLWGAFAAKKKGFIDLKKHKIIQSVHPSPLSAYRGFFGSKPFSKINSFLGDKSIKWCGEEP